MWLLIIAMIVSPKCMRVKITTASTTQPHCLKLEEKPAMSSGTTQLGPRAWCAYISLSLARIINMVSPWLNSHTPLWSFYREDDALILCMQCLAFAMKLSWEADVDLVKLGCYYPRPSSKFAIDSWSHMYPLLLYYKCCSGCCVSQLNTGKG